MNKLKSIDIKRKIKITTIFLLSVSSVFLYFFTLQSQSKIVEASASNLIGWWKLDEGSGNTATDSSGSSHNGTWSPYGTWATGHSGSAGNFSLANQYLSVGDLGLSGAMSMEFWMKPTTTGSDTRILSQITGSTNQSGALRLNAGGIDYWTGGSWISIIPGGSIAANTWYFVAVTVTVGNIGGNYYVKGYLNSISSSTATIPGSGVNLSGTTTAIGAKFLNTYGANFTGLIDDLKIYNAALNNAQIANDYAVSSACVVWSNPADGQTNVPNSFTATWTENCGNSNYDVWLGTTAATGNCATFTPSMLVGTTSNKSIAVNGLQNNTSYCIHIWRYADAKSYNSIFTTQGGNLPIGTFDSVSCQLIQGWACDPDDYNQALAIHVYIDGPAGGGGTLLTTTTANVPREAAVASACGGNANHGFSVAVPTGIFQTGNRPIYVYAINIGSGSTNPQLSSSPKTLSTNSCQGYKGEGLYVRGSMISSQYLQNNRDLSTSTNANYPALIVNDDPLYGTLFKNDLRKRDYTVREVQN